MNMQRTALTILLILGLFGAKVHAQSLSGIVVNEVFTGNPDWIEIANLSASAQSISNWQIQASFGYTVYPVYTFPSNTVIAAGECIIVLENSGNITSVANPHPTTTQIFNTNFGYGWIGTSTGAITIIDDQGQAQDLLVFGNGPHLLPPGAGALAFSGLFDRYGNDPTLDNDVYRNTGVDTDVGSDWLQSANGSETPGQANPGQSFGAPALKRINVVESTGNLVYDPATQNLSLSAQIESLTLHSGLTVSSPSWDSLIGGTVTLSGAIIGNVSPNYDAMLLVPAQIKFTDCVTSSLTLSGVVAAEIELEQTLAGPYGTQPFAERSLSSRSFSSVTTSGASSQAMIALQVAIQSSRLYFVVRFEANGPRLVGIDVGRDLNAAGPTMESRIAHVGQGGLEIGVIRASMNAVVFNVFVISPATALGQGPVEGIEWGASQWQQVFMPLPSFPFHVNPVLPGAYHFAAPDGTIPQGVWLDHVAIQVLNGLPVFSAPTRAYF